MRIFLINRNVGQIFGRVLRPQTARRRRGGHAHFPAKKGLKIEFENKVP